MSMANLPALREGGLNSYLAEIHRLPMLSAAEETALARAWRKDGDRTAAHRLVTSHLRLVAKMAFGYRGYGLPVADLIAEGNIGLMHAVKKFDPERGFRLATYALWWIKAAIQEYILHSWSLVKIGTTAAQKKLFFNLKRLKNEIQALDSGELSPAAAARIATELAVPVQDVVEMNRRLAGPDHSLNAPRRADDDGEWQDWLASDIPDQESVLAEQNEQTKRAALLQTALARLDARERAIFSARRLQEPAATLEDLAQHYGVSRERVRQLEARAMQKVEKTIRTEAPADMLATAAIAALPAPAKGLARRQGG